MENDTVVKRMKNKGKDDYEANKEKNTKKRVIAFRKGKS